MITDNVRNLFQFIEFLHENIENFNRYNNVILELNKASEKIYQLGTHFKDIREKKILQREIDLMWNVVTDNILNPIINKVAELDVCDWSEPTTLPNNYFHVVESLSSECDNDDDLGVITKTKKQYINFKINASYTHIAPIFFGYLDKIMNIIIVDFYEEGDKMISKPITENKLIERENLDKPKINTSLTGKIKALFDLIDFLHSNITNFKKHDNIAIELEKLRKEYNSLGPIDNYKVRLIEKELQEQLYTLNSVILYNISIPILETAISLDVYDLTKETNVWDWSINEVKELHENLILDDVPVIQKYGQMYSEYRMAANNHWGCTNFFKELDRTFHNLFSFYSEEKEHEHEQTENATILIDIEENEQQIQVLNKTKQVDQPSHHIYIENILPIETNFSVSQWGAILLYSESRNLLPKTKTKSDKIKEFLKQHNIPTSFNYLKNSYYEANKRINKECNYPTDKLEDIIPFMERHYEQTVSYIESDIRHIENEKREAEKSDY